MTASLLCGGSVSIAANLLASPPTGWVLLNVPSVLSAGEVRVLADRAARAVAQLEEITGAS